MQPNTRIPMVAIFALAVLIAGCGGQQSQPTTTATTSTPVDSTSSPPTSTTTPAPTTETPTPTSTQTPTPTPSLPENQWEKNPVTVAVEHYTTNGRNITPLVLDAIEYWNANSTRYADVDVTFQLALDASNPDVRIVHTNHLPRCGADNDDYLGCAPLIKKGTTPPVTAHVEIMAGYDTRTTRAAIKHEFGHVLGLDHDDVPQPLMNATAGYSATLPKPNATSLPFPWQSTNLSVYIENNAGPGHNRQAQHALEYFEDGAHGTMPVNVSLEMTSERDEADIVIGIYDTAAATELVSDDGSSASVFGRDPDDDDALEYYSQAEIGVAGINNDGSAWHIAYWLAYTFGYSEDELPDALDPDSRYDERRSEWWEE